MKTAVVLHGTDGSADDHWLPWLRGALEAQGYTVYAPALPDNHTPSKATYEAFFKRADWDFSDSLLIGHSSGATTILNLLMADWFPHVKASVLVGAFLNEDLVRSAEWYEAGQFDNLFVLDFDIDTIKAKCKQFIFVHGDDDLVCRFDDALDLSRALEGDMISIAGGGHLGGSSGITEIPELLEVLKIRKLL